MRVTLSFARGVSPSQSTFDPLFATQDYAGTLYGFFSAGLPSIVLAPQSTIQLQILRFGLADNAFAVENVVVSMTRASQPTEINSGDDTVPLLTPENLDEQAT